MAAVVRESRLPASYRGVMVVVVVAVVSGAWW